MNKPVLFLIFNRTDTTLKVFEKIREAQPPRLYIASDGPRKNKDGEEVVVRQLRKMILDKVDWPCEVKTLFRDKNLGCGMAVSSAITWFFIQEEDGIILEDDCLPHESFFRFCEELLCFYKNDQRVMHITGDQFVPNYDSCYSYYFAKIQHCWGWASWSDRWLNHYQYNLIDYPESHIDYFSKKDDIRAYWKDVLRRMKNKEIDTWDYQWTFAVARNNGYCINPAKNLVSNIGFGANSTHTSDCDDPHAHLPTEDIGRINHPEIVAYDMNAVEWIYRNSIGIQEVRVKKLSFRKALRNTSKRLVKKFYGK